MIFFLYATVAVAAMLGLLYRSPARIAVPLRQPRLRKR